MSIRAPAGAEELGPEADWCTALRDHSQVQEFVLRPGDYHGPCTIRRGGSPEAPLVIRAKESGQPSRIVYADQRDNALNIRADYVTIEGIDFGPTRPNVDAVRIHSGDGVRVEGCRFNGVGGAAIAATSSSILDLSVQRNQIIQSRSTAIYLGCHDGVACIHSDLTIQGNYIDGVEAPAGEIGYGIQVKLNSTAAIRDNVIVNTKGPGIMVYGAIDPLRLSVIERNFVGASRASSAIVVGGGPVVLRNNIVAWSAEGGIALENYGRRGLMRGIAVIHNTVFGNLRGGILAPQQGHLEARIVNNAVHALRGTPTFPTGRPGVVSVGNVDCTARPCFLDPALRDFSPLLLRPGEVRSQESWAPGDDFFGHRRGTPPVPGAIERTSAPIRLGLKSMEP